METINAGVKTPCAAFGRDPEKVNELNRNGSPCPTYHMSAIFPILFSLNTDVTEEVPICTRYRAFENLVWVTLLAAKGETSLIIMSCRSSNCLGLQNVGRDP